MGKSSWTPDDLSISAVEWARSPFRELKEPPTIIEPVSGWELNADTEPFESNKGFYSCALCSSN